MPTMIRTTASLALTSIAMLFVAACAPDGETALNSDQSALSQKQIQGCGGPGHCEKDRYCEGGTCFDPSSSASILMCQCGLLDPSCGLGFCDGASYVTGPSCGAPFTYPAASPISASICGGATMDPQSCCAHPDNPQPAPCDPTWGPGVYHDTYFRDATGTNFLYPIVGSPVLPGYQVCDYDGAVTPAACSALWGVSSTEPILQNSYCQQFTDASDTVLHSISFAPEPPQPAPCDPTWGPGVFTDTYFRDATGTDFLYPIVGTPVLPGYQVCDYSGTVTPAACSALWGVSSTEPILQNSYCQQFTDASDTVLHSISFAPPPPQPKPCAPQWGPGFYHDTYFRDATGTNYPFPIVGSPVLPGYQVCDYDSAVTHVECAGLAGVLSSQPILMSSYCQQFTDASNSVLSSIAFH